MSKTDKKQRYQDLRMQLQAEIAWLDGNTDDIDEAVEHYKKAKALIAQMQKYLEKVKAELESTDKSSADKA